MDFPRIAQLLDPAAFRARLAALGLELPFDEALLPAPASPLAAPLAVPGLVKRPGNRFCVQPMEGWDAETDGRPSELVRRRWRRFGESGAKLVWGGEAAAVSPEARANPRQLVIGAGSEGEFAGLRGELVRAHAARWDSDDLVVGLQLTHSGRFSRPTGPRLEPRILYRHPFLDAKFGLAADHPLLTDGEVGGIVGDFVAAAVLASRAGFDFVDLKHCHGYLGHEFLSAVDRPGAYGGSFANRTRFLRELVAGIRSEAPGLALGVRLSAFDFIPFKPGPEGRGVPEAWTRGGPYPYAFGGDGTGLGIDLAEVHLFLDLLGELGVGLVNITAGSPYYTPHIQRPALYPPSDGYRPPEDPLVGVARQLAVAAELRAAHPRLAFVGSAFSYLQEWLPAVGQALVREGRIDFVGLGRMVLSYPGLPADVLAGRPLERRLICRTFSDCTTAPRGGKVSGCYPLDDFYKARPEAAELAALRRART